MKKNIKDEIYEIDLIYIFLKIWKGKSKVLLAAIISLTFSLSYIQITKTNLFSAKTEIKRVAETKFSQYSSFKNLEIIRDLDNDFTEEAFFSTFINLLVEKSAFIKCMKRNKILVRKDYINNDSYDEAIGKLASSINITSKLDKRFQNEILEINFEYDNLIKWNKCLQCVEELVNKEIKENMYNQINNSYLIKKKGRENKLQDIKQQINNRINDYDKTIKIRLSFLKEHSAKAKKIELAKNTLDSIYFLQNSNSNIFDNSLFYLRGYEVIDKEIELINSRENKKLFIEGLFKLETEKRDLEQDNNLEREMSIINSVLDKYKDENFKAASLDIYGTKTNYINNNLIILILSLIFGLAIGVFYVLIFDNGKSIKIAKKK